MDANEAHELVRDILLTGGMLAQHMQHEIEAGYKNGADALTAADLAVSALVRERLSYKLDQPGHGLVDEEAKNLPPAEMLAKHDYVWVVDPIDGTAGYMQKRRMWGVTMAVFKHGKPLAGGIYLPGQDELLMTGPKGSTFEDLRYKTVVPLKVVPREIVNSQTFVETYFGGHYPWGEGQDFAQRPMWANTPESAVQGIAYTLAGRAAGTVFPMGFSFWDIAAAVTLVQGTGAKIRSVKDGREMGALEAGYFRDNWKLAESWVLAHDDNHDAIVAGLKAVL